MEIELTGAFFSFITLCSLKRTQQEMSPLMKPFTALNSTHVTFKVAIISIFIKHSL